jgi:hypothetical protein
MKDKYIEEQIPHWFIFGELRQADRIPRPTDVVDLADAYGDVYVNIQRSIAEKLELARDKYQEAMKEIYQAHPEIYKAYQRDPRHTWNNQENKARE